MASVRLRGGWVRERRNLAAYVNNQTDAFLKKFADRVEKRAKEIAPKRTGRMAKSIKAKKVKDLEYKVRVGAFYGIYVEKGTRYMAAQPFLRPAIEEVKAETDTIIKEIHGG